MPAGNSAVSTAGAARDRDAGRASPFRRVLVADCGPRLDPELLAYGAGFLKRSPETEVIVAARPEFDALRSFGPLARSVFSAQGLERVSCRYVPEPEVDEIYRIARDCSADIILARAARNGSRQAPVFDSRSLRAAPCALWLAAVGPINRPERIAASVDLEAGSREILDVAAKLANAVGASDLLALHVFPGPVLDPGGESIDRLCDARSFDLGCLAARLDLEEPRCSVKVAESLDPPRTTVRLAEEGGADLLLFRAGSIHLRDVMGRVAVLAVPDRRGSDSWLKRWWHSPEPAFN